MASNNIYFLNDIEKKTKIKRQRVLPQRLGTEDQLGSLALGTRKELCIALFGFEDPM